MRLALNAMGTPIDAFHWGAQEGGLVLLLIPLK